MPYSDRVAVVLMDKRVTNVKLSECESVETGVPESTFRYMFAFPRLRDWLMQHYARSDALPLEPCIVYFPMLAGVWITPSGFVFVALRKDWVGTPLEYFEVPPDLAQQFLDTARLAISIPQVAPSRPEQCVTQLAADIVATEDVAQTEPRRPVPRRRDAEETELRVAEHLRATPSAKSKEIAEAIGISNQRVRTTAAWKQNRLGLVEERARRSVRTVSLTDTMLAVTSSRSLDPAEIASEREERQGLGRTRSDDPEKIEPIEMLERKYLEEANAAQRARFYQLSRAGREHELRSWDFTGDRAD
jgi:hypothetical protein